MSIKTTPCSCPRLENLLGQFKMNLDKYFFSCFGSAFIGKILWKGYGVEGEGPGSEHQAA